MSKDTLKLIIINRTVYCYSDGEEEEWNRYCSRGEVQYIGNIAFYFDDTAYTKNSWKNSAIFSHVRAVLRSLCGPFFSGAVAALKILL